jgi:hypothetical protein
MEILALIPKTNSQVKSQRDIPSSILPTTNPTSPELSFIHTPTNKRSQAHKVEIDYIIPD